MLLLCSSTYSLPYSFYMYLIVSLALSRPSILLTLRKFHFILPGLFVTFGVNLSVVSKYNNHVAPV